MHMYANFSGLFIYLIILVTARKKLPHTYTCTFKWSFFCHVRELASLVVLKTLLDGAEHTEVAGNEPSQKNLRYKIDANIKKSLSVRKNLLINATLPIQLHHWQTKTEHPK